MSVAKTYGVIFKNRGKLIQIVNRLQELFPETQELQKKYKVAENVQDLKSISRIFIFLNLSGVLIYNITPIAAQLKGLVVDGREFQRVLPTEMYFLFDPLQPVIFEILYVTIAWTGITLSAIILATDLLFCAIISLLSLQFRILAQKVLDIKHDDSKTAIRELKDVIKLHQEMIAISVEIEKIFSPIFLINVLSSCFVICLTGFQAFVGFLKDFSKFLKSFFSQVILGSDPWNLIRYILLLSPSLMQIFLLCLFSEKLTE